MNHNKVTLKYIAEKANVTVSTVYKALHGAKGVGDRKRREILDLAERLQYTRQLGMLQKVYRFAAVLPKPTFDNQFFYQPLWAGIRKRMDELKLFNLEFTEFAFEGGFVQQQQCLQEICTQRAGEFDVLLTVVWHEAATSALIDRLTESETQVFTVSADAPLSQRTAAVITNFYKTGRIAAEYLGAVLPPACCAIIAGTKRDATNHKRSVQGFFDQMNETNSSIKTIELYESARHPERLYETLRELVVLLGNVKGIFLNNARATGNLCAPSARFPELRNICVMGSELFEQSAQSLRNGNLNAIIDQNAFTQGYRVVELAFQQVVCGRGVEVQTIVPVRLLLKNSLL